MATRQKLPRPRVRCGRDAGEYGDGDADVYVYCDFDVDASVEAGRDVAAGPLQLHRQA